MFSTRKCDVLLRLPNKSDQKHPFFATICPTPPTLPWPAERHKDQKPGPCKLSGTHPDKRTRCNNMMRHRNDPTRHLQRPQTRQKKHNTTASRAMIPTLEQRRARVKLKDPSAAYDLRGRGGIAGKRPGTRYNNMTQHRT